MTRSALSSSIRLDRLARDSCFPSSRPANVWRLRSRVLFQVTEARRPTPIPRARADDRSRAPYVAEPAKLEGTNLSSHVSLVLAWWQGGRMRRCRAVVPGGEGPLRLRAVEGRLVPYGPVQQQTLAGGSRAVRVLAGASALRATAGRLTWTEDVLR